MSFVCECIYLTCERTRGECVRYQKHETISTHVQSIAPHIFFVKEICIFVIQNAVSLEQKRIN